MAMIRVVVATPIGIEQIRLERLFEPYKDIEVIAYVEDLSAAYQKVEETMPHVVLLSSRYTKAAEYSCMVSLFNAVEAAPVLIQGATATDDHTAEAALGKANAPMITTRMTGAEIYDVVIKSAKKKSVAPNPVLRAAPTKQMQFSSDKVLLIGASTGGIDALTNLLASFPANCPPTAIVQHTGRNYSETLVRLLKNRCAAEVVMAQDGLPMQVGRICLAGGINGHLRLAGGAGLTCSVVDGPEVSGHRPSIDELFSSAARIAPRVIAVLLTGMGRDGASGLKTLRLAGAQTIGQDEATSVVYGMPRVAFEIGAVETQLPLDAIGPELMARCSLPASNLARSIA